MYLHKCVLPVLPHSSLCGKQLVNQPGYLTLDTWCSCVKLSHVLDLCVTTALHNLATAGNCKYVIIISMFTAGLTVR